MTATIIGQDEDGYYLIDLGMGELNGLSQHLGQIYYEEEKKLYPPTNLASIESRQEWELYTGDQDVFQDWLESAKEKPLTKQETSDIETM